MGPELQRRVQRYGWDKAANFYEDSWQEQLRPAHDLVMAHLDPEPGQHILELAAGTGLVSFRMAQSVGINGQVLATDISDSMVTIGNSRVEKLGLENISFERAEAEKLSYPDAHFDSVVCALGLMYFPHPEQALAEMYRVLQKDGKAVVAVWGSRKHCGWSPIFPIVDARVKTDVCPMFFHLGEGGVLEYHFEQAGFREISFEKIKTELHYASAEEACVASFLGGPVAMAYSRFDEVTKQEAQKEYIQALTPFKTENGYKVPAEYVVLSAIK
ncbi:class I SAM-dependent methyltransferase [Sediminicola luteus]|uniref:Dimethylmenaquinone methyltransferase n=1 Tax=Sediminicola luteus TaxID=319238 RepID=A0A2A4GEV8_9FLAO|nr:methyltransferase domain-containing protein [Sediminicola luteus]PCE66506.1 dimethylmenaquinone methyltransferase [Sediminicola luteus]